MSLSLLLLLMVGSSQASHFLGTVITYYPKDTFTNGSVQVVLRYKTNFNTCVTISSWACLSGVCGNETLVVSTVNTTVQSSGEWCQKERKSTRLVPTNAPFQLHLDGQAWVVNIQNVKRWKAVILVEMRNRSDTGKANTSPQTTILPLLRVPSNCSREFNLLAFDPDGDEVVCRYAVSNECSVCTTPSVLSLSSSCSLSFSPTTSGDEGSYAVQLMMEDFPRQTISLTQTDGSQVQRTVFDSISKIPIQFFFRVDSTVPSCTEGLYLPRFLPPTPANRAQLYTQVNQPLEISIKAEANVSIISELLFSGPYNTKQMTQAAGDYVLRWTPSEEEAGESHPICFVVQANLSSMKYQSELRCVIVTVRPGLTTTTQITTTTTPTTTITPITFPPVTTTTTDTTAPPAPVTNSQIVLKMTIKSAVPLSEDVVRNTVLQQIKDELVKQGLPGNFSLRLISYKPTTTG